jgi:hypothetical protein
MVSHCDADALCGVFDVLHGSLIDVVQNWASGTLVRIDGGLLRGRELRDEAG